MLNKKLIGPYHNQSNFDQENKIKFSMCSSIENLMPIIVEDVEQENSCHRYKSIEKETIRNFVAHIKCLTRNQYTSNFTLYNV